MKNIYRFLLAATAIFYTVETPSAHSYLRAPNWEGIPAKDVTDKLSSCKGPDYWRPEIHAKKICQIDDAEYFMKAAADDSTDEAFAREFAINVIGIKAPSTEFMYEKKGVAYGLFGHQTTSEYFIASRKIDNFKSGNSLRPPAISFFNFFDNQRYYDNFRINIAKKIGEHGISKLAVAMTFYDDLHENNWGYDKDGLVLIDVDTMPQSVSAFFDSAILNTRLFLNWISRITLTVNNIKDMKAIYESMLHKPMPVINHVTTLSPEMIETVIKAYIEACNYALQRINHKMGQLKHQIPSIAVTNILIDGFREVSMKYDKHYARQFKKYIY